MVQASGALAQGLDVEQTAGTNLPTAACSSPGTDFWFAGPGQRTAGRIQVYLMNASGQAADADVEIFTDAGPLQDATDNGITVPPHGMIVQSLAPVLGNSRSLALHVRTSVGQVAAAVQESTGAGQGTWLPAAQAPSTHLVIPGLPAAAGSRDLYLSVPGVKDANVSVSAVTSRGTYEPTGAGGIDIPGGSATEISLPSLAGIPAALKLTASAPIAATIMIPGGTNGSPGSFTAAAPAIEEQGVIADNVTGAGRASALILSAPHATARVSVAQISSAGSARRTQTVQISSGKSAVVALKARARGAAGHAVRGGDLAARGLGPGLRGPGDLGQRDRRRAAVAAPGGQFADHDPAAPGPQRGHLRRAVSPRATPGRDPGLSPPESGQSRSPKPGSTSSGSTPSSRANSSTTTSKTSSPSSSSLSARADERPPVHHDPRRPGHRPAGGARRAGIQPGQGHALRPEAGRIRRRDLLDRELHPGQLSLPARLQPGDRLQDELVEPLRPAPVQGDPGRGQHAAQPAPMPVAPPDPGAVFRGLVPVPVTGRAQLPRVSRVLAWRPAAGPRGRGGPVRGRPIGSPGETRSCSVPRVVALPPADGYGQPL